MLIQYAAIYRNTTMRLEITEITKKSTFNPYKTHANSIAPDETSLNTVSCIALCKFHRK